ncbi:MAG: hypothetical protein A2V86_08150 [Deltaproteobacteria bacterium RBG_16_49_23]|nr:MAG: hypothetical protein A2V86_08150 [Deltaproteobacteria bacterium RBG_16_49_23]
MISRKRLSPFFRIVFLLSILLFLAACEHSPEIGPGPLAGFSEKATALVTTTVRGQLRDNPPKQTLLAAQLPSFEKTATMNQLMDELKGIDPLKNLAYLIETDIMFELQKPEHHYERSHFNSSEIQREVVLAIITGMKRALAQLKGGKGGA